MKRIYYCLKCNATLNPNVKIIMTMVKKTQRGLALFSPRPGNYNVILSDDIHLKPGDMVDFHCPVCGGNLKSEASKNLAELGFRLEDGSNGRVNFSRKFGEQATYFVTSENVRSFGENAEVYSNVNFFGEGIEKD